MTSKEKMRLMGGTDEAPPYPTSPNPWLGSSDILKYSGLRFCVLLSFLLVVTLVLFCVPKAKAMTQSSVMVS